MQEQDLLKSKIDFHKNCMFILLLLNLVILLAWGTNITGSFNRLAFFITSIVFLVLFFVSFGFYYRRHRQLVRLK